MPEVEQVSAENRSQMPVSEPPPPERARKRPLANLVVAGGLVALVAWQASDWWSAPAPTSPFVFESGSLVAAGELEDALYDPSSRVRDGGLSAGDSFVNANGDTCRRFADGPVRGIACQRDGDWRVMELRQD